MIKNKVIFVRYHMFDNSKCTRLFPYDGESWFVIKSTHFKRFLRFVQGSPEELTPANDLKNWTIVKSEDMKYKEIYGLDFQKINSYVMGETEEIPPLEKFSPSLHCCKWKPTLLSSLGYSQYEIESMGIPYWTMQHFYQVVIRK